MKIKELHYIPFILLFGSCLLDSCHFTKKITQSTESTTKETTYMPAPVNSPNAKVQRNKKYIAPVIDNTASRESPIVDKYASILSVSKQEITNYDLYNFMMSGMELHTNMPEGARQESIAQT